MTLASESLPLSGLKVLSVEFYGAGPFCTQYLSTFGADVIKIENSTQGGDFARTTGPNSLGPEDSLYFQSFIKESAHDYDFSSDIFIHLALAELCH